MLDRITGMQVFARVAALGSFSAAARALGMSPAMATKHVDALEDRLGARLFFRSTRKLTLTDAGQRHLAATERILAEIEEAEAAAAEDVVEPRGTLRINAPLVFGLRQVMPALADFARALSGAHHRHRAHRPLRRSDRRRLGHRHPSRHLARFKPDRAQPRADPRGALRIPRLSRRARHAQDGRRSRRPQLPRLYAADAGQCRPLAVRRGRIDRRSGARHARRQQRRCAARGGRCRAGPDLSADLHPRRRYPRRPAGLADPRRAHAPRSAPPTPSIPAAANRRRRSGR